jgi:hypothetical protein
LYLNPAINVSTNRASTANQRLEQISKAMRRESEVESDSDETYLQAKRHISGFPQHPISTFRKTTKI